VLASDPADIGNAQSLVKWHGAELRHCWSLGWFVWDHVRWRLDEGNVAVTERAKATARRLYQAARGLPVLDADEGGRQRARQIQQAKGSAYISRIRAMTALAQSDPAVVVSPDQLDADPWLLNVENGVVDLRTGALSPHDPKQLHTKLAPVTYRQDAECPRWERFLKEIMGGDDSLIRYLQRALGYALTGDTSEQVLFIVYGSGANGKSTLLEAIRRILGDYASQTPAETFLRRSGGGDEIRNDLARLHRARFVLASETEGGMYLDHARVKQLTGGDRIAARFLYREYFEFTPCFKVFLSTNHRPTVRADDDAIWRRLRFIPFLVSIPESQQDKSLPEKLQAEYPGILRWLVEGCVAWQQARQRRADLGTGLETPSTVQQAGAEYRAKMRRLAGSVPAFVSACCVRDPVARATGASLYAAYRAWCPGAGHTPLDKITFGKELPGLGLTQGKLGGKRAWIGLRLATPR
jgi:putative DNA primase/helicase